MQTSEIFLSFIVVSFCFALILILMKNSIPGQLRKYLATFAVFLVLCSFALVVYSFFGL